MVVRISERERLRRERRLTERQRLYRLTREQRAEEEERRRKYRREVSLYEERVRAYEGEQRKAEEEYQLELARYEEVTREQREWEEAERFLGIQFETGLSAEQLKYLREHPGIKWKFERMWGGLGARGKPWGVKEKEALMPAYYLPPLEHPKVEETYIITPEGARIPKEVFEYKPTVSVPKGVQVSAVPEPIAAKEERKLMEPFYPTPESIRGEYKEFKPVPITQPFKWIGAQIGAAQRKFEELTKRPEFYAPLAVVPAQVFGLAKTGVGVLTLPYYIVAKPKETIKAFIEPFKPSYAEPARILPITAPGEIFASIYLVASLGGKPYGFEQVPSPYAPIEYAIRRFRLKTALKAEIKRLPAAQQKVFLREFKKVTQVYGVEPMPKELQLQYVQRLPAKARAPTMRFLQEYKQVTVTYGSLAQRTQMKSMQRLSHDIDIAIRETAQAPRGYAFELARVYREVGIKRVSVPPKEAMVTIAGKKVVEFKPIEHFKFNVEQVLPYMKTWKYAVVKTPSGLKVMRLSVQAQRKLVGGLLEGRPQDIPDFRAIMKSLIAMPKERIRARAIPLAPEPKGLKILPSYALRGRGAYPSYVSYPEYPAYPSYAPYPEYKPYPKYKYPKYKPFYFALSYPKLVYPKAPVFKLPKYPAYPKMPKYPMVPKYPKYPKVLKYPAYPRVPKFPMVSAPRQLGLPRFRIPEQLRKEKILPKIKPIIGEYAYKPSLIGIYLKIKEPSIPKLSGLEARGILVRRGKKRK